MKTKNLSSIISVAVLSMITSLSYAACQGTDCTSEVGNGISSAQQQQQQAASESSNQGNAQSITYNNAGNTDYSGSYTVKSVPPIAAPSLTTTLTETCMGSTTGGVAVVGLGITGGTTWKDEECVRRLNARELAQTLGEKDAAKELLCGNPEINAVYQSLGRPCLMKASNSYVIPGGALINYRDPVEPRTPPVEVARVKSTPRPVMAAPAPQTNKEVRDEEDNSDFTDQQILKKAEEARLQMKAAHGF